VIELDDDGFIEVAINGTVAEIDLYKVYNRIVDLHAEHNGTANAAIVAYMAELGFPAVSERAAVKFANAVSKQVADLKKKEPSVESPEPTPG